MDKETPDAKPEREIDSTTIEILLKQYEIFFQRFTHLGRLFWQTLTIFVGMALLVAKSMEDASPAVITALLLFGGLIFGVIGYSAHRHKSNQDSVYVLLARIEASLASLTGFEIHRSVGTKKYGARFLIVMSLYLSGLILFSVGVWRLCQLSEQPTAEEPATAKESRAE